MINQVLLNDMNAPNDLITIFEWIRTILEKANKVSKPHNIKASLDTQIEKFKNASINVESLTVAHENFFLYGNEHMLTETNISELNENISIYGLITFLGKTNNRDSNLHLTTPKCKLKFNLKKKKDAYKNKIEPKLGNFTQKLRLAHREIVL